MATRILPSAVTVKVNAASTANLTLSGAQTVDGVALTAGMTCLAKDQSTGAERAIYFVESGAWTLADPGPSDGLLIEVLAGTANGDVTYKVTNSITWGSGTPTFVDTGGSGGGTVTLTGTQTLTNKTLTSPVITGPTITGTITGPISGDLTFLKEANHSILVAASTTATTVGGALSHVAAAGTPAASGAAAGAGGVASVVGGAGGAAFAAAASGGAVGGVASLTGGVGGAAAAHAGGTSAAGGGANVTGGVGGAASADAAASAGGATQIKGGVGGAASAAQAAGAGGAVSIVGGAAGSNALGGGSANGGAVNIDAGAGSAGGTGGAMGVGTTNASQITFGKADTPYSFNGVAPAAVPTPAGYSTMQTAGSTTSIYIDTATTGGVGSTQFTFGDVVAALKTIGLLKQ